MTNEQAKTILHNMMLAVQHLRSRLIEDEDDETYYAYLFPWLTGKGYVLIGLEKVLSRNIVDPFDFYNFMCIANKTTSIKLWFSIKNLELPEPDTSWLKGWKECS